MKKLCFAALVWLAATSSPWSHATDVLRWQPVDLIEVHKGKRKLYMIRQDEVVREFDISLGGNPVGHKLREGDFRTPEGNYKIDLKNPDSNYYLSVRISYPNAQDRASARRRGVRPGGNIMIHGLPLERKESEAFYRRNDWTEGCIAVSNAAMQEIWLAVQEDTPVKILP